MNLLRWTYSSTRRIDPQDNRLHSFVRPSTMMQGLSIGEYGFISLVHDTEGNMIGLHSMK